MTQPSEPKSDAEFAALAFSTLPEVSVSPQLSRRVAQIPQEKVWYWPFDRVWQPSLALAALALMGVLTGSVFDTTSPNTSEVAELLDTGPSTMPTNVEADQLALESEDDDEFDNLFALALGESWQETIWDTFPESATTSPLHQEELHQ